MNLIAQNLLAFVIGLGFLIFVHESGHFFMAKLFGVRVLVFSFGFGKRLGGFRKGDTDYRVSLIPLGGYVRMAGDAAEENPEGAPDEFLSKPKWQRFLILVAGPAMNLLIAIAFVAGLAVNGIEETVSQPVLGEIMPNRAAAQAGLKSGDRILAVKGEPIENFDDLRLLISMNAGTPLKVVYVRDGVTRMTTLTPEREDTDFGPIGRAGFYPGFEPIVGRIAPGSPAAIADLRAGDRILSVNGKAVGDLLDYAKLAEAQKKNPIRVDIARGPQRLTLNIGPINPADEDRLGAGRGVGMKIKLIKLTPFPALRYSVEQNWRMLKVTMSALGRLVRAEGSVKELSGPINIARISGEAFRRSFPDFIGLLAAISLQLGMMNLLPIPVLDGGHILILLIEGVARRDLSIRVKERIQQVGFAALATLMIVVLYNDVISNVLRIRKG